MIKTLKRLISYSTKRKHKRGVHSNDTSSDFASEVSFSIFPPRRFSNQTTRSVGQRSSNWASGAPQVCVCRLDLDITKPFESIAHDIHKFLYLNEWTDGLLAILRPFQQYFSPNDERVIMKGCVQLNNLYV